MFLLPSVMKWKITESTSVFVIGNPHTVIGSSSHVTSSKYSQIKYTYRSKYKMFLFGILPNIILGWTKLEESFFFNILYWEQIS